MSTRIKIAYGHEGSSGYINKFGRRYAVVDETGRDETIHTLAGDYEETVADLGERNPTPDNPNTKCRITIARHVAGHFDVLVSDNATVWAFGNPDSPEETLGQMRAIASGTDILDVSNVVNWLEARIAEAGVDYASGSEDERRIHDLMDHVHNVCMDAEEFSKKEDL